MTNSVLGDALPPHSSAENFLGEGSALLSVADSVGAAVDSLGHHGEVVGVGVRVDFALRPEPGSSTEAVLGLEEQVGLRDQVEVECLAAQLVVRLAGDLDRASAAVLVAVGLDSVAEVLAAAILLVEVRLRVLALVPLAEGGQTARLVTDLTEEVSHSALGVHGRHAERLVEVLGVLCGSVALDVGEHAGDLRAGDLHASPERLHFGLCLALPELLGASGVEVDEAVVEADAASAADGLQEVDDSGGLVAGDLEVGSDALLVVLLSAAAIACLVVLGVVRVEQGETDAVEVSDSLQEVCELLANDDLVGLVLARELAHSEAGAQTLRAVLFEAELRNIAACRRVLVSLFLQFVECSGELCCRSAD